MGRDQSINYSYANPVLLRHSKLSKSFWNNKTHILLYHASQVSAEVSSHISNRLFIVSPCRPVPKVHTIIDLGEPILPRQRGKKITSRVCVQCYAFLFPSLDEINVNTHSTATAVTRNEPQQYIYWQEYHHLGLFQKNIFTEYKI